MAIRLRTVGYVLGAFLLALGGLILILTLLLFFGPVTGSEG